MEDAGLQINLAKSKWAVKEAKYLGYIVTTNGYSPDPKKIQGLLQMKAPKNKRQVWKFLGGINFYRKLWQRRSHILAPLTDLTGNTPFVWSKECQTAFDTIKATMAKAAILYYPNYSLPFLIFPDASEKQLGAHISQIDTASRDYSNIEQVLE